MLTPTYKNGSDREAFVSYFLMFAKRYHFNAMMDPFAKRTHGPEWFSHEFLATGEREAESKKIWANFLTPRLLSIWLGSSKEVVKILCYQPNMELRQFGIRQTKPKSFFSKKKWLVPLYGRLLWRWLPSTDNSTCQWSPQAGSIFLATLSQHLTNVFSSLQQKFKKVRAGHIKEIQAF